MRIHQKNQTVILPQKYSILPARSISDPRVSGSPSLRVLAALCLFTSPLGIAFPNQATLAKILDCHQSTISRHIKRLESLGYVRRLLPKGKKKRGSFKRGNRYQVLMTSPNDPLPSLKEQRLDRLGATRQPPEMQSSDIQNEGVTGERFDEESARKIAQKYAWRLQKLNGVVTFPDNHMAGARSILASGMSTSDALDLIERCAAKSGKLPRQLSQILKAIEPADRVGKPTAAIGQSRRT